jgi:hypothetical protein
MHAAGASVHNRWLIALLLALAACGPEQETSVPRLDRSLTEVEQRLSSGEISTALCFDYIALCEQGLALCLEDDNGQTYEGFCSSLSTRCRTTSERYCRTSDDDAGTASDGGLRDDSGSRNDSGTTNDAGGLGDAGPREDAGRAEDAGSTRDGGVPRDGGIPRDGGVPSDGGAPRDGGTLQDAGIPAGVITSLDPRRPFSVNTYWGLEVVGLTAALRDVKESGVSHDNTLSYGKVADPDDASKRAFLYRISATDPLDRFGSIRTEAGSWTTTTSIVRGAEVWILWALRLPDLAGSSPNEGQCVFQLHMTADGTEHNPSFAVFYSGGNTLTVRGSYNLFSPVDDNRSVDQIWFKESGTPVNQWQYFVMHTRRSWDSGVRPFVKIWRSVGDGAPVLLTDRTGPNAYRTTNPREFMKEGMYHWGGQRFDGPQSRTRYSKGVHAFTHQPEHSMETMLQFLKSI